jgi:glycosyltransferase involved in cell wall biosynthesis
MYNEQAYVRRTVEAAREACEGLPGDWQVVIVDDASSDEIIQIGVDDFPRSRGIFTLSSPSVIWKILGEMLQLRRDLR